MKYAKDVLVVSVVVILGAIGFIVTETVLNNENSRSDGHYDYSLSTGAFFITSDGDAEYAPDGLMFVFADVLLKNIDWHGGISDGMSYFELEINGERRTAYADTALYPAHTAPVLYLPGQQGQNHYLYLVPEGSDTADMRIVYTGSDRIRYEPGLLPE